MNLDCLTCRRFGVEVEILSFDGIKKSINYPPAGATYVANMISKLLDVRVEVQQYSSNHNNDRWIVKPDSSCGMEISSPILKGKLGLSWIVKVVDAIKNDSNIKVDDNCSLHIHVNISDLSTEQIGSVIANWMKCEPVFMDAMKPKRKSNKYCQFIGQSSWLTSYEKINPTYLIKAIGDYKYYSLSTYHYVKKNRDTLEFRIMCDEACKDPFTLKNWIKLILHFVDVTSNLPFPSNFLSDNVYESFRWLNPKEVFELLNFDKNISFGLKQVKDWFLLSLFFNSYCDKIGMWSPSSRSVSIDQIKDLFVNNSFILDANLFSERYDV